MRYAVAAKYPKVFQDRAETAVKQSGLTVRRYQLSKGYRLMNPKIRMREDGNDFVRNLVTVLIEFDRYKIPRIIKRLLK